MGWWGKLIGGAFGYMLGGPLGALVGAGLGHSLDSRVSVEARLADHERTQMAFFTAVFSVMGHVSKADGRVSEEEIALARAVMDQMQLNHEQRRFAINLFREGKQGGFDLDEVLEQFRRECHQRRSLFRIYMEILLQAAYADGDLHSAERDLLAHICQRLGIGPAEYARLETMVRAGREFRQGHGQRRAPPSATATGLAQAYEILSVSPSASEVEIKKAYRRLMNQHHPDKLVAKGLPEEMVKLASQKTYEIRSAYDQVRKARGF